LSNILENLGLGLTLLR